MRRVQAVAAILVLGGLLLGFPSARVDAEGASLLRSVAPSETLSPYWDARIQRWSALILQEADRRGLDADLVASLIWRESRGDPKAVGPAGAIGLMQIMPKEAGFSWRPSRDELFVPFTNVYWGTRTLSTVIRQGRGDVFSALAAYNGGWDKVNDRGPRSFASTILRDYAHAVALRHNLEGHWVAFFAIADEVVRGPIWVVDAARTDVYFYSDVNATPEGVRLIPVVSPTSVAAQCEDDAGGAFSVGIWIYHVETQDWLIGDVGAPLDALDAQSESVYEPEESGAVSLAVEATSTPVPVATERAPSGLPGPTVAAGEGTPATAASSLVTPTATVAPVAACAGGPLSVDTYPLDRINTPEGWMVRVYASAAGGTCRYTYAWNDESAIRGVDMQGPIVFELTSERRDSPILGTVVVMSGEEMVRVKMYIRPPE